MNKRTSLAYVLGAFFVLVQSSPAIAEVCDKARPAWGPEHGPVSVMEEAIFIALTAPSIIVFVLFAAIWLVRSRWISTLSAFLSLAYAGFLASSWWGEDEVTRLAVTEGCINSPIVPIAVLAALTLAAFVRACWLHWANPKQIAVG